MANTFEERCYELDKMVEDMSDSEKKFVLWELLEYYRDGLLRDINFKVNDSKDCYYWYALKRHIESCKEMRDAIGEEIF